MIPQQGMKWTEVHLNYEAKSADSIFVEKSNQLGKHRLIAQYTDFVSKTKFPQPPEIYCFVELGRACYIELVHFKTTYFLSYF